MKLLGCNTRQLGRRSKHKRRISRPGDLHMFYDCEQKIKHNLEEPEKSKTKPKCLVGSFKLIGQINSFIKKPTMNFHFHLFHMSCELLYNCYAVPRFIRVSSYLQTGYFHCHLDHRFPPKTQNCVQN